MTNRIGDPELHFWLTRSVGRVMGINYSEELAAGTLSSQGYADLVTRCRACPYVADCQKWLSGQSDDKGSTPPGCVNGARLEALAQRH